MYSSVVTLDILSIRVSEDPPFSHTDIDYADPLYTHSKNSDETNMDKAYISVLTCASTTAVHLELALDFCLLNPFCCSDILPHGEISQLH